MMFSHNPDDRSSSVLAEFVISIAYWMAEMRRQHEISGNHLADPFVGFCVPSVLDFDLSSRGSSFYNPSPRHKLSS